jgi:3-isopropylmalate dehydrogenase
VEKKIAVLAGDGIGPEVIAEGIKVLKLIGSKFGHTFQFTEGLVGWAAIDATGGALPQETIDLCQESDAIFFGAVGDPQRDQTLEPRKRPEPVALLNLRKGLFANLRPAILYGPLSGACPLKSEIIGDGIDIMIVRELTGGLYYGRPKMKERYYEGYRAVDTMAYTSEEIQRIMKVGFETAMKRKKKLCSVDKANILATSQLWREIATEMGKEYPEVELTHLYVDNCSMQLIRNPRQFDVIVTENTFGDILSDEASMLTGSIGMLPSASLGSGTATEFYEPIHGSAVDIAGKGLANPLATILTGAMMLRYSFNMQAEADVIENAVIRVLEEGYRTGDIMQEGKTLVGTSQMGDAVVRVIEQG